MKAQVAMEFLTTYGWVIVVVVVGVGMMAYFGMLSPSRLLPNTCIVNAPFVCEHVSIVRSNTTLVVITVKNTGSILENVSSHFFCPNSTFVNTTNSQDVIASGESIGLSFSCPTSSLGSRLKGNFAITYDLLDGNMSQIAAGSIEWTIASTK